MPSFPTCRAKTYETFRQFDDRTFRYLLAPDHYAVYDINKKPQYHKLD